MAKEFDVGFLGLHGSIDEETAKAIFRGDFDITAQAPDITHYSEQDRRVFEIAKKVLKNRWNDEMYHQGIKAKPSDFSDDHPPTLLKNKNAEVLAALTTELQPNFLGVLDSLLTEDDQGDIDTAPDEEIFGDLSDQIIVNYITTILTDASKAVDDFAKEKGTDVEGLSDEEIMKALDRWADEIIGKEMEILTTGQQAKELFLLSREIPQESDFSGKKNNRSRSYAYRKLYHTRSKITVCLFSDYLEDQEMRENRIGQASPEELAEASAYVEGFYGLLSDSDRRILELMLDGKTQSEIASELKTSQSKVSKRRKHLQQVLLEYDPNIQKILHLFKNNSKKME